jgi:RNA polymerase-binding protein DksA
MSPENVAALAALVKAPASSASKTILPTKPTYVPANPVAKRTSTADSLEEIQAASERVLAVCNLDREFHQLRHVRAALRGIQEGSFGTCQQCDEDIHSKRLAAVPWAPLCIRCQEAVDGNPEEMQAPSRALLAA